MSRPSQDMWRAWVMQGTLMVSGPFTFSDKSVSMQMLISHVQRGLGQAHG